MRKIDKIKNIKKINLLLEQRYFIDKNNDNLNEDWKSNLMAGVASLGMANNISGNNALSAQQPNKIEISKQNTNPTPTANINGVKTSNLNFKLKNNFNSGEYNIENNQEIKTLINNINDYVNKNKGALIKINIVGSESLVPSKYKIGELAKLRANELKNIIENNVDANLNFDIKTVIGKNKWQPNKDVNAEEYLSEQFVQVNIEAYHTSCSLKTISQTKNSNTPVSTIIYGKVDNSLIPGNIPDRMVLKDINGKILSDTGFFSDGSHSYGNEVKYVPKYLLELTKLYRNSDISTQGLNAKYLIKIKSFEDLLRFCFSDPNYYETKYSKYTEDFNKPLMELKKIVENGGVIVTYDLVKNNERKITYDLGDNNGVLQIFSPIVNSDFQINSGFCK